MPFLKSDRQSGYQTQIKRLIVIRHSLHFCDAILIVSPSTIFTESSVGKNADTRRTSTTTSSGLSVDSAEPRPLRTSPVPEGRLILNGYKVSCYHLIVFPRNEAKTVAYHMNDAQLNLGFR